MRNRTDLALESVNNRKTEDIKPGSKDGIKLEKYDFDDSIKITVIDIVNPKGELLLKKPMGRYITIETEDVLSEKTDRKEALAKAIAEQLSKLIPFYDHLKVLVVGLGNEKVTPDSLGPRILSKVHITSHLFRIYDCDGDSEMGNVSGIAPGVSATTGLETADVIKEITKITMPDAVLVLDALAALDIKRVNTTIQICDTGISPGAGMGNYRKALNEETLGVPVIAMGIPTVIDAGTLIENEMAEAGFDRQAVETYMEQKSFDMVVTSTDIDMVIKEFSDICAKAINITLHPGIYS